MTDIPKNCWLDDGEPCPSPCVYDDPNEVIQNCAEALILESAKKPKTECEHYKAETVRVRIAVLIDTKGHYSATGWGPRTCSDNEIFDDCEGEVNKPNRRYWIEADLPVCEEPTTLYVRPIEEVKGG